LTNLAGGKNRILRRKIPPPLTNERGKENNVTSDFVGKASARSELRP